MVRESSEAGDEDALDAECTKSQILEVSLKKFLSTLGENVERDGLQETPQRVVKAYREFLSGYAENPKNYLSKQFYSDCDEMIVVRDVPFISLCEHHMLPFWGTVHVAYIPHRRIVGLSKIPRAVQALARRLQVQERLTDEIAECLHTSIEGCCGVGVQMSGEHSCMKFRGVKSHGSMVTSKLTGVFSRPEVRAEFLSLCKG